MKKKLILIGGGGHCKVCIDIIEQTEQFEIAGILDLPSLIGTDILNYKIIGTDQDISKYVDLGYNFLITVGQIKSAALRESLFNQLKKYKANIATIIAPSAIVSKYSIIEEGTIIMNQVIVNADVIIGENCILNNRCDIEHDTVIGKHVHISTGAILNGSCRIGNGVFVGSNATIANQIIIEDHAIVGAGSVVVKNIKTEDIQAGNPAKTIKK
jgi:sugar O-acyltransferase (sialic acid O-acetyltransferase NeuD family)